MTETDLIARIPALSSFLSRLTQGGVLIIDGPSGAGKSTLAAALGEALGANVYHTDDYFLPPARKTAARLSQPGGNLDYERLAEEITGPLAAGKQVRCRRYDCATGTLGDPVEMPVGRTSVLEGVYAMHPALAVPGALRLFLTVPPERQRERILARSGEDVLARYEREWLPLERTYFDVLSPASTADLVLAI